MKVIHIHYKRALIFTTFAFLIVLSMVSLFRTDILQTITEKSILYVFYILPKYLPSLTTVFLSILIEGLPFILIGVFVSSLIQNFVSEEIISRILPKNRFLSIFLAACLGLIFPVCECGIIPIVRRLINKGVPPYVGISFMLAVPIVNPVVIASTYYAFNGNTSTLFYRLGLGFLVAIFIGIILSYKVRNNPLKSSHVNCGCHHCDHHHYHHSEHAPHSLVKKLWDTMQHACDEFFDMGKYFIFGAFLASIMQTFFSRAAIQGLGQDNVTSTVAMMLLAFLMSICSEADAFVAASFKGTFTTGALTAFLVYGPMIDIKNTLMLFGTFNKKFTVMLIALITILVFFGSYLINIFN